MDASTENSAGIKKATPNTIAMKANKMSSDLRMSLMAI
jgi:hypothetical protein